MRPEEITTLGKDAAIATQPFGAPLYLKPVDYWKLEDEFGHLREKTPDSYWPPPLAYDKNPSSNSPPLQRPRKPFPEPGASAETRTELYLAARNGSTEPGRSRPSGNDLLREERKRAARMALHTAAILITPLQDDTDSQGALTGAVSVFDFCPPAFS